MYRGFTNLLAGRKLIVIFLVICLASEVSAQNLNDEFQNFLHGIQKDFDSTSSGQQQEFNDFIEKQNKEYQDFLEQMDREYADLLEQGWKEMLTETAFAYDKKREPKTTTLYNKDTISESEKIRIKSIVYEKNNVVLPGLFGKKATAEAILQVGVNFYGTNANVEFDSLLTRFPLEQISSSAVAAAWCYLSNCDYAVAITSLTVVKDKFNLNDWAYFLLVKDFSHTVITDKGKADLLLWFLMIKSGYDLRLGIRQKEIVLLISASTKIYDRCHLTIQNKEYYLPDADCQNVQTYTFNYPLPLKRLDLHIKRSLGLEFSERTKKIDFYFRGQKESIEISVNSNLIDFYNDYPQTEMDVYVNTPFSADVSETFMNSLQHRFANAADDSVVKSLLYFVQHAFAYKTDLDQFGREKFFFPEETLTAEYSDCEDRSILFASLVNKLTQHRTVGLNYGGHLLVGVESNTPGITGNFSTDSLDYVLCDPTYVDAPVGVEKIDQEKLRR